MILKNAKIYGEKKVDVKIQNGKIAQINDCINDSTEKSIDLKEKTLLPSFIDLNVNLLDAKFDLDKLENLEQECLKGGVGSIVLRDNLGLNTQGYKLYFEKLKTLKINVLPSIKALDNENKLKDISILLDSGAKAIQIQSNIGANLIRQSMQYAKMKDSIVFVQCFDENFDDHGVMNDGKVSFELGLIGISDIAESSEVAKMKEISQFYQSKIGFDALSLTRSFDLLENLNSEISIHHLLKNDNACENFNTKAKILPPLKDPLEQEKLQKYFIEGKIKFLTSLHSPISDSKKNIAFDDALFGIDSMNMYASLCFTYFVKNKLLSWKQLCDFTSYNQAQFLGLNKGKIDIGYDADLFVFDDEVVFEGKGLYSKDLLQGQVKMHIINGEVFSI